MNKTVLITGASSGFGRLTAKKFHTEGWNVVATMRSPEKEAELTKLDNTLVTKLDVTDVQSIHAAIAKTIKKFGSIDVLINNAGYGGHALFEQFTDADVRAMYDTNVFGLMNVCRAVLPQMRQQKGGVIINVTSIAGIISGPTVSIYSSTKFAVEGLTEGMAHELRPLNIIVKSVAPGAFGTNFSNACMNPVENGDAVLKSYSERVFQHMDGVKKALLVQDQEPADVANKIYQCATKETPIRNVAGADAEKMQEQKDAMSDAEFSNQIGSLFVFNN